MKLFKQKHPVVFRTLHSSTIENITTLISYFITSNNNGKKTLMYEISYNIKQYETRKY